jgi:hypothetical protein
LSTSFPISIQSRFVGEDGGEDGKGEDDFWSSVEFEQPSVEFGQPSVEFGQPSVEFGQPSVNSDCSYIDSSSDSINTRISSEP